MLSKSRFVVASSLVALLLVVFALATTELIHARHVTMWISRDRATLADGRKQFRSTSSSSSDVHHHSTTLHHADVYKAQTSDFALAVATGHQTILVEASVSDLSNGMFYDGKPKKHIADKDPKAMDGGVGEFIGAPKDATHCVRAHIPDDAEGVHVLRKGKPHGPRVSTKHLNDQQYVSKMQQQQRSATAQSHISRTNSSAIDVRPIQFVDTRTNPTIVFISAGYTDLQRGAFFSDVDRATFLLSGIHSNEGMDAGPWKRYYSMFNVYAVFEASAESGASFKVGELHECPAESASGCRVINVNNNLECAYGTPLPRVLGCNYEDIMAVAGFAPLAQLVVVLVNENAYGGSGGSGLAVVNTGANMELTLLHQLNHAVAGLGDEYEYGLAATPRNVIPNCRSNTQPWSDWKDSNQIPSASSAGCTFSNLYRPTQDSCLMRKNVRSMCPVCAEALTNSMLTMKQPADPKVMYAAAPRCPPTGWEIHVLDNETIPLSINHKFLADGNVSVTWKMPTGATFGGVSGFSLLATQLNNGPSQLNVVVTDNTRFVSQSQRDTSVMTRTLEFFVNRVSSKSGCQPLTCTTSRGTVVNYCATCKYTDASLCTMPTAAANTATGYSAPTRPPMVEPKQSESNVSAAVAVTIIIAVAILVGGLIGVWWYRSKNVVEVLVVHGADVTVMWVTVALLFCVFFICMFVATHREKIDMMMSGIARMVMMTPGTTRPMTERA